MARARRRSGGDRSDQHGRSSVSSSGAPGRESVAERDSDETAPNARLLEGSMVWAPSVPVASAFLVMVRMLSAGTTCIGDCDETFNYWEPLHYLLYGFGFQTWEYAPKFALRSYFYLLPSIGAAAMSQSVLALWGYEHDKPQVWLGVRLFNVLCCVACEVLLYSVVKDQMGRRTGGFFLILSGTSAGMFVSAPALLPSSSAMLLFTLVMALWMQERFVLAILVSMFCVFGIGWPFVGVMFVPMLLNCAWVRIVRGTSFAEGLGAATAAAMWAFFCAAVVAALATWTDSTLYGRITSPTLNIIKYNVLDATEGGGDELYGIEPASFYVKNLFLNTTVAFPLAVAFPLVALLLYPMADKVAQTELRRKMLLCSPGFLWLALMFSKPHKEERFLYPAYPSIFMAAAFCLDLGVQVMDELLDKIFVTSSEGRKMLPRAATIGCVLFGATLGMCRTAAVVRYHNAPCNMFKFLYYKEFRSHWDSPLLPTALQTKRVCIGGEWHRYPSSFYLSDKRIVVSFLRSDFHGQLPQPFPPVNGTMAEPLQPFNDLNAEEDDRFVQLHDCDYVLETTYRQYDPSIPRTSSVVEDMLKTKEQWEMVLSHRLLDTEFSHPALRAFFIPYLSDLSVRYSRFSLYRRKELPRQEPAEAEAF